MLVLKLGGFPFHLWYLKIIQKLSWEIIWILSVWQKFIPIMMLMLSKLSFFILRFGFLRAIFSSLRTINQKKLKKILGLSSIFTLGWLIISINFNNFIWVRFMCGYGFTLIVLLGSLNTIVTPVIKNFNYLSKPFFILNFFFRLLILRGVPPFIGFFLKITVLRFILEYNILIALFLLILRLNLIFVYMIMIFYLLTFTNRLVMRKRIFLEKKYFLLDIFIINIIGRILFSSLI